MSIIESFRYAIEGIINTTKKERNLKIHMITMICVTIIGFIVQLSHMEWIICIILIGLVISAELFNTSIEKTLDYANEKNEHDKRIKFIKDASAAGVLVLVVASVIAGLVIFLPKLIAFFL